MDTRTALASAALILAFASTSAAQAQTAEAPGSAAEPAAGSGQNIDPDARKILDAMSAYMASVKTFSLHADTTRDDVLAFGYKLQTNEAIDLRVRRPDRLRADVSGDIQDSSYYYNGKTLTIFGRGVGYWTEVPAPATIGDLIDSAQERGIEMPMLDVLASGARNELLDGVRTAVYVGESSIGGVACDHLAFRQPTIDWQLWVAQGDKPLPRKILITTRYKVGDPQYSAVLTWNMSSRIGDRDFEFKAPANATKIPFRPVNAAVSVP